MDGLLKVIDRIKGTGDGNVRIAEEIDAHRKAIALTNR